MYHSTLVACNKAASFQPPVHSPAWETATPRNPHTAGLTSWLAQCRYGLSRTEAYRKLVLVPAADYGRLAGILSDPNHSFGIHEDLHAVHIFKHYKLHVASFWCSLLALLRNAKSPRRAVDCAENRPCTHAR